MNKLHHPDDLASLNEVAYDYFIATKTVRNKLVAWIVFEHGAKHMYRCYQPIIKELKAAIEQLKEEIEQLKKLKEEKL